MQVQLIYNWAVLWWRFWTSRIAALQAGTIIVWTTIIPTEFKTPKAYHWFEMVMMALAITSILVRIIKQESLQDLQVPAIPPSGGNKP